MKWEDYLMELTLEELEQLITVKKERIEEITNELGKISESIENLATNQSDESVEQMLKNAVSVANRRQELATKEEVLTKVLALAKQELGLLQAQLQQAQTENYLEILRTTALECNKTLETLKNQFKELRKIEAKLACMPLQRRPIAYNYRSNLPKVKILPTCIIIEEDLFSSLDGIN